MNLRVVVLGAGFGGLYAARALRKAPVQVTVIDRKNHHTFQPLLYQVATAGLNAAVMRKVASSNRTAMSPTHVLIPGLVPSDARNA